MIFSVMAMGQLDTHLRKKKISLTFYTLHYIKQFQMENKCKCQRKKKRNFPEEIIGEYLYDLGVGRHFNLVTNSTVEKKNDKQSYIKIFCLSSRK